MAKKPVAFKSCEEAFAEFETFNASFGMLLEDKMKNDVSCHSLEMALAMSTGEDPFTKEISEMAKVFKSLGDLLMKLDMLAHEEQEE